MSNDNVNDNVNGNVRAILDEIRVLKRAAEKFGNNDYMTGYLSALSALEGFIAGLPAVDAAPVLHGQRTYQTIWHTPGWGEIITAYGCCGFQERGKTHHNYCPNCGAKMDGDS